MKIFCNKCNKQLTIDLRPVKKTLINKAFEKIGDDDYFKYKLKKSVFFKEKKSIYSWKFKDHGIKGYFKIFHNKSGLVISGNSFLDSIIPAMPSGKGCCNWSSGQHLRCSCGNLLGEMYLDCYEDGTVKLFDNSTRRFYK